MQAAGESAEPGAARAGGTLSADAAPWLFHGLVAGVAGAALVAVFFFVVDLLAGTALRTPASLGSALFLGRPLAPDAGAPAILVFGYTAIHGGVFVAAGLAAAFYLMGSGRRAGAALVLALALVFFAFFEVCFLGFAALFEPGLVQQLGAGRVALANLLAAAAMALYLVRSPLARE